jgi:hypothetical protein
MTGVSYLNASIQFYASKEYKDLTFHTYRFDLLESDSPRARIRLEDSNVPSLLKILD